MVTFLIAETVPHTYDLKEERIILDHVFTPWPAGSKAGRAQWMGLEEESCSHHGRQGAEREEKRGGREGDESAEYSHPWPNYFPNTWRLWGNVSDLNH